MTALPKSLVLVGAGKMGGAMLRGWIAGGLAPEGVAILDPALSSDLADFARERGVALAPPDGMTPEVLILAVKPQMLDSAAAAIFTLPKDDTSTGTSRCLKRMGFLRGDKINMRYKRLDMECTRTKKDAAIVVRHGCTMERITGDSRMKMAATSRTRRNPWLP